MKKTVHSLKRGIILRQSSSKTGSKFEEGLLETENLLEYYTPDSTTPGVVNRALIP